MSPGQLELVGNSTHAAPHQSNLARRIDARPLVLEARGSSLVVDRRVDELGRDAAGQRRGRVVLKGNDIDIFALGSGDGNAPRAFKEVSELLDVRVELAGKACLDALEDEVERGVVAGEAKGSVATILAGNVVQIPEDILEAVLEVSIASLESGRWLRLELLFLLNISLNRIR